MASFVLLVCLGLACVADGMSPMAGKGKKPEIPAEMKKCIRDYDPKLEDFHQCMKEKQPACVIEADFVDDADFESAFFTAHEKCAPSIIGDLEGKAKAMAKDGEPLVKELLRGKGNGKGGPPLEGLFEGKGKGKGGPPFEDFLAGKGKGKDGPPLPPFMEDSEKSEQ